VEEGIAAQQLIQRYGLSGLPEGKARLQCLAQLTEQATQQGPEPLDAAAAARLDAQAKVRLPVPDKPSMLPRARQLHRNCIAITELFHHRHVRGR
jgi:hypothetical protein